MKKIFSLRRGFVKIYVIQLDEDTLNYAIPFFDMIFNKIVHNLNVFSSRVKYQIFGKVYGASVVAFYHDTSEINSIIT